MQAALKMRQYQQQAVRTASPEQLILKLYDLAVTACHRGDRAKVRAVLVELMAALNFEQGGEVARNLQSLYEFCLSQVGGGDLELVCELISGLRESWREVVLRPKVA